MGPQEMSQPDRLRWEMNHWRKLSPSAAVALWITVARDSLNENACGDSDRESTRRHRSDWLIRHSCEVFWAWGLAEPDAASAFALSVFGATIQGQEASSVSDLGGFFNCSLMACYAGWAELGARGARGRIPVAYGIERFPREISGGRPPEGNGPRLGLARRAVVIGDGSWSSPRHEALDDWVMECLSDLSRNVREDGLKELKISARFEAVSFISWCIDDAKPDWTALAEGHGQEFSQLGLLIDRAQAILDAAEIAAAAPEKSEPRVRRMAI